MAALSSLFSRLNASFSAWRARQAEDVVSRASVSSRIAGLP